ncbi:hypothetical protein SAMN04489727_5622 [Amycolatopsis tolypomycina]|uniref:Nitroreductase family protein n=1 Tax=Amycolatopsis tolypomycina TaxID=208445 RepID=A0A1H4WGS7_9PSEU|nr:hypothetical protein SAMN04489727_5622 [Amycolatopsis tolypomycina]
MTLLSVHRTLETANRTFGQPARPARRAPAARDGRGAARQAPQRKGVRGDPGRLPRRQLRRARPAAQAPRRSPRADLREPAQQPGRPPGSSGNAGPDNRSAPLSCHHAASSALHKHYYVDESVGMLLTALQVAGLAALTHTPSPMRFPGRPRNEKAFAVIPVGYPADNCVVPDLRRKPLDEVLVRICASRLSSRAGHPAVPETPGPTTGPRPCPATTRPRRPSTSTTTSTSRSACCSRRCRWPASPR